MPRPGETIENLEAMAPVVSRFISIQGDEKIGKKVEKYPVRRPFFSGFRLQNAGWR